jgi:tellurite resistance protein TerC
MFTLFIFVLAVVIAVYADLKAHRDDKPITLADATKWSLIYVGISLAFAAYLALVRGTHAASLFLTGYVMEKALSVDNLMVFGAVFTYFGINPGFQHRILRFGIIGAVVFRLIFALIGTGTLAFIGRPVELVFGAFVAWSAWKMITAGDDTIEEVDHANRWYIKWTKRFFPVTADASQNVFFKMEPSCLFGKDTFKAFRAATPLFLCLVAVEITDIMFSFDSVPTVISVTRDPLLVYSAMVFAILGLRSMYFVLEALKGYLTHLGKAVSVVLVFVAIKLVAHSVFGFETDPGTSLVIVLSILACGILPSLRERAYAKA